MDLICDNREILSVEEGLMEMEERKSMTFLKRLNVDVVKNTVVCHKFCYVLDKVISVTQLFALKLA